MRIDRRSRRARAAAAVLVIALAGAGLVTALRWLDVAATPVVPALQALVPVAGLTCLVSLIGLAALRRWAPAAIAAALCAVHVGLTVPLVGADTVGPSDDDLVVMSANLLFGRADVEALAGAVRDHDVDVLVLLEVTDEVLPRIDASAVDELLPHSTGRARTDAGGTLVRSNLPLGELPLVPGAFDQPVVRVAGPDGDVTVAAAHPLPPTFPGRWRDGLTQLRDWRQQQPLNRPLVIAGDFNASRDHPGFREVATTMTDAHAADGAGWVRTWPHGRAVPPFVQIDHVLVRGLQVVDAGEVRLPDTDHLAVWARLSA